MQWEAVSAIGEIIAAIAVVVSLVYLAVQIRQNTKIVAANTFQSICGASSDITMRIAASPELSDLGKVER
jgi:heme/copper-type cytochrome/quinol oxidase subunit 1